LHHRHASYHWQLTLFFLILVPLALSFLTKVAGS